jgi:hypothetical protein
MSQITATPRSAPREIDEALAVLWERRYTLTGKIKQNRDSMLSAAGAKYRYERDYCSARGRQVRVTDMKIEEAVAKLEAYRAAGQTTYTDGDYTGSYWPSLGSWNGEQVLRVLDAYAALPLELAALDAEIAQVEALYTGWSRFFLVTSSPGHVHKSMHCSTCRHTTTFGWLPRLSGKSEPEAVADLGPTLCTVCYPSAPLDWTSGKKLTAAQAAKKVAS